MADIRKQVVFELKAEIAAAQAKVERFANAISKAKAEGRKVGENLKTGLASAQGQLKATTVELKRFEQASKKAAGSSTFLYQQLGYLASDARYGLLGVANNLSIVAVGLQNMAQRAKETNESFFKVFKRGLFGAGGILLGIQVLIALLPEIVKWFKKWKDGSNALNTELEELLEKNLKGSQGAIAQVQLWADVLNDATSSTAAQETALRNLKKYGYDPAITSLEKFIKLKRAQALIDAYTSVTSQQVGKRLGTIFGLEQDLAAEGLKETEARNNAQAATDPEAAGFYSGSITASRSRQKEIKEEIKELNQEIAEITNFGAKHIQKIIEENPAISILFPTSDKQNKTIAQQYREKLETLDKTSLEMVEIMRERVLKLAKTEEDRIAINEFFDAKAESIRRAADEKEKERLQQQYDRTLEISATAEQRQLDLLANFNNRRIQLEADADTRILNAKFSFYRQLISAGRQFAGESEAWMVAFLLLEKGIAAAELISSSAAQAAQAKAQSAAASSQIVAATMAVPMVLPPAIPNPAYPVALANMKASIVANKAALGTTLASIKTATTLGLAGIGVGAVGGIAGILSGGGGSSAGGGGSRPSFNIIGQNQNNALQATIQEQTGILQDGEKNRRVVLVQSELQVKENDNKVAMETATL